MGFSSRTGFFVNKNYPEPAFPFWPTQANTSVYTTEFNLYSGTADTSITNNVGGFVTTGAGAIIPGGGENKTEDLLTHPNGNIYILPSGDSATTSANGIVEYNPNTNTATLRNPNNLLTANGSVGAVNFTGGTAEVGKNGNIYMTPGRQSTMLDRIYEYSPSQNNARFILTNVMIQGAGIPSSREYSQIGAPYASATMSQSGNVWFMPFVQGNVTGGGFLKVDCSTEPVSLVANISFGIGWGGGFSDQNRYGGFTFHPNGNIYCTPFDFGRDHILELDPVANSNVEYTITNTGSFRGNDGTAGCFVGADGNIYTVPNGDKAFITFDPTTKAQSIRTYGLSNTAIVNCFGAVTAPNGNTYLAHSSPKELIQLNTKANTATLGANIPSALGTRAGICADKSNVYIGPGGGSISNTLVRIAHNGTGGTNPTNFIISSYSKRN
jgi:hypothetical protein